MPRLINNDCCAKQWCPAIAHPSGPEWDAAVVGFGAYLDEAAQLALQTPTSCGCRSIYAIANLLNTVWTPRANEYLKVRV
jgi:hypothetical protein